MDHATPHPQISYTSWILGQTSAWLGMLLTLIYGFELVILQAQRIYAEGLGEVGATAEPWGPPFGPPLLGMGVALLGWLAAHHRGYATAAPVAAGLVLNLIALFLAVLTLN